MRRQQLSEAQIAELFDPPTEQRELVRHYTLSEADLAMIRRCRGDHNRLGYALMLCYLRYPGRALRAGERPPAALVSFVAEQIDVLPEAIDDYLASERNRRRHAVEFQERLRLRPFGKHAAAEFADALLAASDRGRSALPSGGTGHGGVPAAPDRRSVAAALERPLRDLRHRARREVHRRLTERAFRRAATRSMR